MTNYFLARLSAVSIKAASWHKRPGCQAFAKSTPLERCRTAQAGQQFNLLSRHDGYLQKPPP